MQKAKSEQRKASLGFTLIELLVAISIIAVLSTIGLLSYQGIQGKARDAVRKNDLNTLATALEIYFQKNSKYIGSGDGTQDKCQEADLFYQEIASYLNTAPPLDPKEEAKYCYQSADEGLNYKLYARLEDGTDYILTSEDYLAQASPTPTSSSPTSTPFPTPTPTPTPPPSGPLRVFVTKDTYTGNLGKLSGADQKCKQAADAVPSLQGKLWRAWLSDSNTSAKDRVGDGRFIRIDNVVVAQNKQDLVDGSLLAPISVTETGGTPSIYGGESNPYVWTGTDSSGNATSYTCATWDQPETTSGTLGLANATDSRWTNGAVGNDPQCQTYQRHLYCFEQPAPSTTGGTNCLTAYQDFDNDGYTVSSPVYFCNTTTLPYGYKSSSSTTADCYDQNPNAKPGQTQFFSTHRGDGSFDYNCDGAVSPQYSNVGVSCYGYSVTTNSNCSFTNPTFTCNIGHATTASNCGQQGGWTGSSPAGYYMWNEEDCDLTTLANAANEKLACK